MNEIGEHFVLLGLEARSLAGTKVLTRRVGTTVERGEVLAALDSEGQKHLLIPVAEPQFAEDHTSQGVTLGRRELMVKGQRVTYADLHCTQTTLELAFERLLDDVLSRLSTDTSAPVDVCRRVLDEWRALLRVASAGIARETIVGLVGELEVLRLLAERSPAAALDAWRGPTRSLHDFVRGGSNLEVKATASVDGDLVHVSNIDQLDPSLATELYLVVVHLKVDATAPSLDDRIDHLIAMGFPSNELIARIRQTGYIYEMAHGVEDRYSVRRTRAWRVGESFPGLRAAEIPTTRRMGITNIRYSLHLGALPSPLTDSQLRALLERWTRAVL